LFAKRRNGLLGLVPLRQHGMPVSLPLRIVPRHDGSPPAKKATNVSQRKRRPFAKRLLLQPEYLIDRQCWSHGLHVFGKAESDKPMGIRDSEKTIPEVIQFWDTLPRIFQI
jgi:hypothetical protein